MKPKERTVSNTQNIKNKKNGYILMITFLISGFILTLGMGLAKIITTELQFSADLLWGEEAYFAAESGMEYALWEIKENPISYINIIDEPILKESDSAVFSLDTGNGVQSFSGRIQSGKPLQFRLKYDADSGKGIREKPIEDLFIQRSNQGDIRWKVQCKDGNSVSSISGVWGDGDRNFKDFSGEVAHEELKTIETFRTALAEKDQASCFLSFESDNDIDIQLLIPTMNDSESPLYFPPPKAMIRSKGLSGDRKKIIQFGYAQKNLDSFFNFGLLNQDE